MKTILVAGGAGFIGSHLCERLLKEGNKVIAVDNLLSGKEKNIFHLMNNKSFEFHNIDIISKELFDLASNNRFDEIFNLASLASPVGYQRFPVATATANSIGTYNLLKIAMVGNSKFLFASTSEVYGDPLITPQSEDDWSNVHVNGIRSCYDLSKAFGETLIKSYNKEYKTNFKIVRIFNTYGPKMGEDGRVMYNFIKQALINKPLMIYGGGKQTRSFCYIDDQIEGLIKMMDSDEQGPINIGNPDEISILGLAQKIKKATKSESTLTYRILPEDDPQRRCPNIEKARTKLKWKPKVSLDEGLKKTIEWFKKEELK